MESLREKIRLGNLMKFGLVVSLMSSPVLYEQVILRFVIVSEFRLLFAEAQRVIVELNSMAALFSLRLFVSFLVFVKVTVQVLRGSVLNREVLMP